jgi:hypothetical protein
MFHSASSLADSIRESLEGKTYWNFQNHDLNEFIKVLGQNNEPAYPELLNYAPLKGEFVVGCFNAWFVVTNYRFTLKLHVGQFSIPLSAIVKFGDYRSSNGSLNDKALAFYAKLNEGKKSGWLDDDLPSLDDDYFVWIDQSGDVQRFDIYTCKQWIKHEIVSLAVSKGYWQDLSDEETSSIYYSADRAKKKYSYEPISIDDLKSQLGHVGITSSSSESKESIKSTKDTSGENILSITSKSLLDKILSKASDNNIKVAIDCLQNDNIKGFNEIVQESKNKDFDSETTKTLVALQKYFMSTKGSFTVSYPELIKVKGFDLQKSDFNESAKTLFESSLKEMVLALSLSMILEKEKQSMTFNSLVDGMKVGLMAGLIGGKNKALSNTITVAGMAVSMSAVYSQLKAFKKISDFNNSIKSNTEILDALNKDFGLEDSLYDLNEVIGNDMGDKLITIPFVSSNMSKYESPKLLSHFDKPYLSKGNVLFAERLNTYIDNVKKKRPTILSYLSIFGGFFVSMTILYWYEQILLGFLSFWFFLYFIPFGKRSFLRVKF